MHPVRFFIYIVLAICGGIICFSFVSLSKPVFLILFACAIVLTGLFWQRAWFVVGFGVLWLSFLLGAWHTQSFFNSDRILDGFIDQRIAIIGYIVSEPNIKEDRQELVLKAIEYDSEDILIITKTEEQYNVGDILKIEGRIILPKPSETFDYRAYLASRGIFVIIQNPKIEVLNAIALSWWQNIERNFLKKSFVIKKRLEIGIESGISKPESAFLIATLLGGSQRLPAEVQEEFRITGTSHVMAVSGYNVSIIIVSVFGFLVFIIKRQHAFWIILFGIVVFTVVTGLQASIIRAAIMGSLFLVAQKYGRLYASGHALIITALIMMWHNPYIGRYDVGFQLSILATAGLIYISPLLKRWTIRLPVFFGIRETLTTTVSAQLAVAPLLIVQFRAISLISLPTNILLLPLIPITMLFSFCSGLISIILPRGAWFFGLIPSLVGKLDLGIVHFFSKIPFALLKI